MYSSLRNVSDMYLEPITLFFLKTLILQFYVNCTIEVFSHLQVCTIYLVNYYISKLVHESEPFLCSKHKLVKSKFFDKNLAKNTYRYLLSEKMLWDCEVRWTAILGSNKSSSSSSDSSWDCNKGVVMSLKKLWKIIFIYQSQGRIIENWIEIR